MLQYLVVIAALIALFACFSYIRSMFRGEARPNRVSWLIWSIAPMIATAAALSDGVRWAVLPVFMSGFSPFLIFIFSFVTKKAYWKLTAFDYACGVFSTLALILWGITKNPDVAIFFAIASDGLATIPTVTKAWTNPETEFGLPFLSGIFGGTTGFLAIKIWTFSSYAFPTYLVLANIVILFSIYRKKILR